MDTTPPTIEKVKLNGGSKIYAEGDTITVRVVFNEPIILQKPDDTYLHSGVDEEEGKLVRLELNIGSNSPKAKMSKTIWGKGKSRQEDRVLFHEIVFQHTVRAKDDNGRIVIPANALTLVEGVTIMDLAGNEATDITNYEKTTKAYVEK